MPYVNEEILLGGFHTPGVGVVDSVRAGTRDARGRAGARGVDGLAEHGGDGNRRRERTRPARPDRQRPDRGRVRLRLLRRLEPPDRAHGRRGDPAHAGRAPDDHRRPDPAPRADADRDRLPDRPRHGRPHVRAPVRRRHGGRLLRAPADPHGSRRHPLARGVRALPHRAAVHLRGLRGADAACARADPRDPGRRGRRDPLRDQRPALADPGRAAGAGRDARGEEPLVCGRRLDQGRTGRRPRGGRVGGRGRLRDRRARLRHRAFPSASARRAPRRRARLRGLQQDLRDRPPRGAVGEQPERPRQPVPCARAGARRRLLRDCRLGAPLVVRVERRPARGVRRPRDAARGRVGVALVVADRERRAPGDA